MSSERTSTFWYTSISVAAAAAFFLATGDPGRYPPVARYGGAAWVFLLSMVITMPLVSSYFRHRRRAAGEGGKGERGGSEIPGVPGAASSVSPRVENKGGMVMAKDPVCGMDVDPAQAAGSSVYGGETFHFCSRACKEAFDRNPGRYVSHPGGAAGRGLGPGGHRRHGCRHCC